MGVPNVLRQVPRSVTCHSQTPNSAWVPRVGWLRFFLWILARNEKNFNTINHKYHKRPINLRLHWDTRNKNSRIMVNFVGSRWHFCSHSSFSGKWHLKGPSNASAVRTNSWQNPLETTLLRLKHAPQGHPQPHLVEARTKRKKLPTIFGCPFRTKTTNCSSGNQFPHFPMSRLLIHFNPISYSN